MRNLKVRIASLLLCVLLIVPVLSWATPEAPQVSASNYALINQDTGEVLLSKGGSEKKYPASTTKIMTAILAIEYLDMEAYSVASNKAVMSISWDSSKIGLYEGEALSNKDLLTGMLIASGNDAANVLAEAVSGSIEDFVALMNKRAKELGCEGTNFTNTHGLTDENHYTTALDMAKIAKKAMEYPLFREIVKMEKYELPITDKCQTVRTLYNTNNMITKVRTSEYYYSLATGVKTGYTDAARHCLVASAEKDGSRFITVVLGADNINGINMSYPDSKALFEWAFKNYKSVTAVGKDEIVHEKSIKYAKGERTAKIVASEAFSFVLPIDADKSLMDTKVTLDGALSAPIKKGEKVGKIEVFYDGEYVGETELSVDKDYEYSWFKAFFSTIGKIVGIIALVLLGFFVLLIVINQVRYEKRRKERIRRKREE